MLEPGLAAESKRQGEPTGAPCPDEDQLVRLAKADPQFFGNLYDFYYCLILNYVFRRTFDVTTAEEITSNTFFKALRGLADYDHRGRFGAWLYRIAGNEIRLHWRAASRRPSDSTNWRKDYARVRFAGSDATSLETFEEQVKQFDRLHDALRCLPERYQTVLALRYFEGMSCEEVAEVSKRKVGSVKSLIHRGLKQLRRKLEKQNATFLQERHYEVREK